VKKIVIVAGATFALVTAGWRCRYPAPTARLSAGPVRQDADWQDPHREDPDRQDAPALCAVLIQTLVESEL
jgi:hypothetical protein